MRISDWSSDVCSSDLPANRRIGRSGHSGPRSRISRWAGGCGSRLFPRHARRRGAAEGTLAVRDRACGVRSEEHTSELQSLMRISYAVFCLKKKNKQNVTKHQQNTDATVQYKHH